MSTATLVVTTGHRMSLRSLAGKVLVVSDMMTLCQETCPLDTANIVAAARAVQRAGLGKKVEFLSITIDPSRDTIAQFAAYRKLYSPAPAEWAVLTASSATLGRLWRTLGVLIERVPESGSPPRNWRTGISLSYDLTDSDEVFFIDTTGRGRFLPEGSPHVAPGAPIRSPLAKFIDHTERSNLRHPARWPGRFRKNFGCCPGSRGSRCGPRPPAEPALTVARKAGIGVSRCAEW